MKIIKYEISLNSIKINLSILTLSLAMVSSVTAGEEDSWSFTFAPFVWMAGQEGRVATLDGVQPTEIDLSFGDILENFDIGLMGIAEARKGRFGVLSELFYISVSTDTNTPGSFFSSTDYEQDFIGITLGGFYRLIDKEETSLDVLAGIRWWGLDNKMDFGAGILPAQTIQTDEDWIDPIIGIKGRTMINANWYISGWVVAAVAGDSDSVWDLSGNVGYAFSETKAVTVGYRYQKIDFEEGSFLFDVELSGPILGFIFNF